MHHINQYSFLILTHNICGTIWCCVPRAGPWFSVEGKNEERGVSGVSYLRKLYVTVNGVTVTLMKARRTMVRMTTYTPVHNVFCVCVDNLYNLSLSQEDD